MHLNKNKQKIDTFIPILCLYMFAFIPTSNNANIYNKIWIVFVWSVVSLLIITLYINNKTFYNGTIMRLLPIMIYMVIITLITINSNLDAKISIARIAPIVLLTVMNTIEIRPSNKFKLMKILLNIFFISMVIWNLLILLDNNFIKDFTRSYYSQYYDLALYYSMLRSKPVMSFGVHTYASYFYIMFFYLSFVTAKVTKEGKYYLYCVCATIFTFFLTSNTSLVYSIIMVIMLLKLFKDKPILISMVTIIGLILLIQSSADLIERYIFITTESQINGLTARYTGVSTVFSKNIEIIKSNYAIGFTILGNIELNYTDSGYLVYLTMGNIPLVFAIYYMIFTFLRNNIPRKFAMFIYFIIFSFEFALPLTFNYRYFFMIIFVIYYLNSLDMEINARKNII